MGLRHAILVASAAVACHREPARPDASFDGAATLDAGAASTGGTAAVAHRGDDGDGGAGIGSSAIERGPRPLPLRLGPPRRAGEAPIRGQRILDDDAAAFPAIRRDRSQIVIVSTDAMDFVGTFTQTLRFLDTRSGKTTASFIVYDGLSEGEAVDEQALERLLRIRDARLKAASARLAASEWETLEHASRSDAVQPRSPWAALDRARAAREGGTGAQALRFGDAGVDIELELPANDGSAQPMLEIRRAHGDALSSRTIPVSFPPLGRGQRNTPCGFAVGLEDGYLDSRARFALLIPAANLGGDSCRGELAIDRLVLVRLPD